MKTRNCIVFLFIVFLLSTFLLVKISKNKNLFFAEGITTTKIEKSIKDHFPFVMTFRDLRGTFMSLTHKSIIGDFEFFKDPNGKIRTIAKKETRKYETFLPSMKELSQLVAGKHVSLLYVEFPDATSGDNYPFRVMGQKDPKFLQSLKDYGFSILSPLENDKKAQNRFYFSTDFHFTTRGEFNVAKEIAISLKDRLNIKEKEIDKVFNLENYTVRTFPFYGNMVRNIGSYYSPPDRFEFFFPKFKTDLVETVPSLHLYKTGSFKDVCVHNLESSVSNYSPYNYWVVNYGHFPQDYYEIRNILNPKGPTVLFICDSTFMRGFSYFSLLTGKTIVFDPRVDFNSDTLRVILETEPIDAIVVLGYSDDFFNSYFKVNKKISKLEVKRNLETLRKVDETTTTGWLSLELPTNLQLGDCYIKDDQGIKRIRRSQPDPSLKELKFDFIGENPEVFCSDTQEKRLVKLLSSSRLPKQGTQENNLVYITSINNQSVNTSKNSFNLEGGPKFSYQGENVITGWGADGNSGAPFKSLSIKNGNSFIACKVGLLRMDVANFFKNQFTERSGFECKVDDHELKKGSLVLKVNSIAGKTHTFTFKIQND